MKTIIFVGSNKSGSSYEALKASTNMKYYTVLLTNRETFMDQKEEFPHVHLMEFCDINNIYEIRKTIKALIEKGLDIHAIVSFIDPYCYIASVLAWEFGLKYFSSDALEIMLNKVSTRKMLEGTPYSQLFREIRRDETLIPEGLNDKLPLILKAPNSAGSKDVYMIRTDEEMIQAYNEIREKYPNSSILAEEYLDGPQYLIETVTVNRETNIIAIIEQEITFTGRFIVTGYKMILERDNDFYLSLKEAVNFIIDKFGMKNGSCHLEFRYVNNEWKLIEANPRISGGAMNLFIETAFGINLVKETLKFALGINPDFQYKYKKETFLQYSIAQTEGVLIKVTGRNNALNCPGVKQVYIKPKKGSIIMPPSSMAYRYAYVIATGDSAEQAKLNAKYGASKINFYIYEQ